MTTHASPLGVSKRQAPPEGFTCYQPLDEEPDTETPIEAIAAVCGLLAVILFFSLLAAAGIYFATH